MLEDDYSAPESAVGEEGLAEFWPNNPWYKPYTTDMPLDLLPEYRSSMAQTAVELRQRQLLVPASPSLFLQRQDVAARAVRIT